MLRVLPPTFKPLNNLICCKTGLIGWLKRATSLFNSNLVPRARLIQLVLQQCCKTSCTFFVVRFSVPYELTN